MQVPAGNPVLKVRERKTRAVGLPGDLMSTRNLATALDCHIETVRQWIRDGKIPSYWFNGLQRVSMADVLALQRAEARRESVRARASKQ